MKPRQPSSQDPQGHLYRVELRQLIDLGHPLAKLAAVVEWTRFDETFSPLYDPGNGRPAIPTRLMVGLHYLKHLYQLSDEDVVAQWVENPYWQHLCGSKYFEHEPPMHPTSMTKWRGKIAAAGAEPLLAETIAAGLQLKIVKPQSLQRVVVDTTVQPKAVAYPTDAKLYDDMRRRLVRLARREGLGLRQSYARCGKRMLAAVGRSARGRHKAGIRKHTKKLKTYLGRVIRDIDRKLLEQKRTEAWRQALRLARQIYRQQRGDANKIYSVHAPDTECIAKGKLRKPFEFGHKVSLVTTAREQWVLGALALPGRPFDGHTLAGTIAQVEAMMGQTIRGEIYVDKGYRGHDYQGPAKVLPAKSRRKQDPKLRRWYNKRNGIEAMISHMKNDGWLGRNYLKGMLGSRINALLAACGQNLRKLLAWLETHAPPFFCALLRLRGWPLYSQDRPRGAWERHSFRALPHCAP
jgi:IS5 family transposase